uniref:Uncharacterized protein n=1 Tax=Arundo donax TaxID=35708 RepID=A0A0A8Y2I6_ARUDO
MPHAAPTSLAGLVPVSDPRRAPPRSRVGSNPIESPTDRIGCAGAAPRPGRVASRAISVG